ncbi:MAG TPA: PEP/pyruvate-binding domain-containing protein [Verrucomicrobiae bacterium]|nr:PEP/pyruvate-binding domain-containing protein [Verrucomicrobiae bacterium]
MPSIPNIFTPEQCLDNPKLVGGKALHLAEMQVKQLLPVPPFVVLPTLTAQKIVGSELTYQEIAQEVVSLLVAKRYAVRSSALLEDTGTSAMAGQFSTLLGVTAADLPSAIERVLSHAVTKTGDPALCAVVIQTFVPATYSGVLFTRNPEGGREAVVEYVAGAGEDLVSGRKQPERVSHTWNQAPPQHPSWLPGLLTIAKSVEDTYGDPQDIEWCVLKNKLHILQSRPVTTCGKEVFEAHLFLDRATPSTPFTYEQTEVAEVAPRPTPFTLSLLKKIYAPQGPVEKTYQAVGVTYASHDFLRTVGNQLYVDREVEKKCFFPSRGFTASRIAAKNRRALQKLKPQDPLLLRKELEDVVTEVLQTNDPRGTIDTFLRAYASLFRINLTAQTALGKLEAAGKPIKKSLSELLEIPGHIPVPPLPEHFLRDLKGNSLEVTDESPFQVLPRRNQVAPGWFSALPTWKQAYVQPYADTAQAYLELRELVRQCTICLVNHLRKTLYPLDPFVTVEEHLSGQRVNSGTNKKAWEAGNKFTFPSLISSYHNEKRESLGISPGTVSDLAVQREGLPTTGKAILVTALLTPDIVDLFPHISGIIAETGGLLSHLAIMAREAGIPVVSNVRNSTRFIGKKVTVNGSDGTVIIHE